MEEVQPIEQVEQEEEIELMTPSQVGVLFGVDAKTVSRWANSKPPKIDYVLTPGKHKRYLRKSVEELYNRVNPPGTEHE